jgi:hypothetical protein
VPGEALCVAPHRRSPSLPGAPHGGRHRRRTEGRRRSGCDLKTVPVRLYGLPEHLTRSSHRRRFPPASSGATPWCVSPIWLSPGGHVFAAGCWDSCTTRLGWQPRSAGRLPGASRTGPAASPARCPGAAICGRRPRGCRSAGPPVRYGCSTGTFRAVSLSRKEGKDHEPNPLDRRVGPSVRRRGRLLLA